MGEPVAPVDPEDLPFVSDGTKTAFGLTRKPRTDPDPLRQARANATGATVTPPLSNGHA